MLIAAAAAAQALAAGSASAQNAATPAPATNATDVGPAQLRDFTLNGTVTRPAETRAPQPSATAPATQAPRRQPSATSALPPARAPSATSAAPQPMPRSATVELPAAPASAAPPATGGEPVGVPQADVAPSFAPEPAMPDGPSILPWLLAAMLVGAGAAYYLFRVRPRAQLAAGPDNSPFTGTQAAEPRQRPVPPAPAPEARPRAVSPAGGAVVSTRLRPWIEIDVIPERTIVSDDTIAIEFTAALYNSGSAPARDVRLEAAMFNASPTQDQQIAAFFGQAAGRGDRIELVAPLQRVMARSSVVVPRAQVRPLHAEGRPLLVPMLALTVVYRWGSNNNGQSSASYLVGKETGGDKLAPFRLDLGPRVFRGLAVREHQLRVRN